MITRSAARLAAAGLLLPLLLTACGGESDDVGAAAEPTSAATSAAASPLAVPTPSSAAQPTGQAADDEDATVVSLTVAGGKVTGDTGRVPVPLGARVRLTVLADTADEVHLHGYDLHVDTTPGSPVNLEFVADRPGVFEAELEESRVLLTRLQVQ